MSAGTFISACFRKTSAELRAALKAPEKAAADHEIPAEWARHYLTEELNRGDRRR